MILGCHLGDMKCFCLHRMFKSKNHLTMFVNCQASQCFGGPSRKDLSRDPGSYFTVKFPQEALFSNLTGFKASVLGSPGIALPGMFHADEMPLPHFATPNY